MAQQEFLVIADLSGGRNSFDPPESLAPNQCVEATNVDWYGTRFGRKRPGTTTLAITSSNLTTSIDFLGRYVPGFAETSASLLALDGAAHFSVLTGGTTWTNPSVTDAPTGNYWEANGVNLNGKYFLAYQSGVDRLHVWDGTTLRRTGLATPAVPTAANTAAGGSYPATIRYYRVRYTIQVSGVTTLRSEPSTAISFTPSGSKTGVDITKPATISEGETHWELEASADNAIWFVIATTAVATPTVTDTTLPANYTGSTPKALGWYTVPVAARFLAADDARLLMTGAYNDTTLLSGPHPSPRRVWWTDILGTDVGDDERVTQTLTRSNYLDVEEATTGIAGPLNGCHYVFSNRRIWKLVPTGVAAAPYQRLAISHGIGCIRHQSIAAGEDENGVPALFFLSHRGPYRLGTDGLNFIGQGVRDLWATMNLTATKGSHTVWHADIFQVWFFVPVFGNDAPVFKLVYDVRTGGWSYHTLANNTFSCSVLFSNTVAASMSRDLKPYTGSSNTAVIVKHDTGTTDIGGTGFSAVIRTRAMRPERLPPHVRFRVDTAYLKARADKSTLKVAANRDFVAETHSVLVDLETTGTESRRYQMVEGSEFTQCSHIQYTIGDDVDSTQAWMVDELVVPVSGQEPL